MLYRNKHVIYIYTYHQNIYIPYTYIIYVINMLIYIMLYLYVIYIIYYK